MTGALPRPELSRAQASLERDPQPWGVRTWLGPLVVLTAGVAAGQLVAAYDGPGEVALAVTVLVGGELAVLAALLVFGRPVAVRAGGWRAGFGLDRVRGADWLPWLLGLGIVFACRTAVVAVAGIVSDGRALEESSNLPVGSPTVLRIVVLTLAAVVLAPITEELMFRGLLLRSFLRRMGFWPAALLSSALFALFHVHQVDTLLGAVTLGLSVGALGLGNCFLVRITGRLAPAMMLHATFNALALLVAFATA
jgi:membrane protease YdiL (CAAX protease family)